MANFMGSGASDSDVILEINEGNEVYDAEKGKKVETEKEYYKRVKDEAEKTREEGENKMIRNIDKVKYFYDEVETIKNYILETIDFDSVIFSEADIRNINSSEVLSLILHNNQEIDLIAYDIIIKSKL